MSADDSHLIFPEKKSANYHLGEELHLESPQRCLKDGRAHLLICNLYVDCYVEEWNLR